MNVPSQFADISSFQSISIDWQAYMTWARLGDGIARVSMRVDEGTGNPDVHYTAFRAGAEASGIDVIIHYHYAYPQFNSALAEANDMFLHTGGKVRANDVIMLDMEETNGGTEAQWALDFCLQAYKLYGKLPTIYASTNYVLQHLQDSRLIQFPLTLANWTLDPSIQPSCPLPWQFYTYFQYTDKATIPGIPGLVDADIFLGKEVTPMHWYDFPWGVRFGTGDVGLGGAHDATLLAPANFPVTFPLSGSIVDLSSPEWGRQIGVKLDVPYNGIPYFAFLHLSAINPSLTIGKHVSKGDLAGWVGGANTQSQYNGTSNPTGVNFTNTAFMSSQVQIGFALMRGPQYGNGAGWEVFPPVDTALNPEQIILDVRKADMVNLNQRKAFELEWASIQPNASLTSGIANASWADYQVSKFHGPALTLEYDGFKWDGVTPIRVQVLAGGRYEWDGTARFFPFS